MKYIFKLDEQGYCEDDETLLISESDPTPEGYTDVMMPDGLVRARFVNGEWVEGATQEEIDQILKPPEYEPTETQLIAQQVTDNEISDMSQWQNITELEIQAMEHGQNITELEIQSMEQGQKITDMEIEQMMQGQAQTDQELRLLELEAKLNV
ncbi:hypothetical protein [Shouchella clausii]|uniref:hypothetical protein n=1 Tax=Shouchella clausii TaxID=79880 RepID=UPI001C738B21|nr:hypothetical protein [Shouchella clausii]MBX0319741.1 hypothetical protein [Shouchella clausii]